MSIQTNELGDHWVEEFAKELKSRRDKTFRSHAACKPGGVYGEQILKAAQAIDRAYQAVITKSPAADAETDRFRQALQEIALAGMSGSGQESAEGLRDWHARRAWEFIGIAARALAVKDKPC